MSALSALKQRLSGRRSLQIGARQLEIGDRLGSGPSPPLSLSPRPGSTSSNGHRLDLIERDLIERTLALSSYCLATLSPPPPSFRLSPFPSLSS